MVKGHHSNWVTTDLFLLSLPLSFFLPHPSLTYTCQQCSQTIRCFPCVWQFDQADTKAAWTWSEQGWKISLSSNPQREHVAEDWWGQGNHSVPDEEGKKPYANMVLGMAVLLLSHTISLSLSLCFPLFPPSLLNYTFSLSLSPPPPSLSLST